MVQELRYYASFLSSMLPSCATTLKVRHGVGSAMPQALFCPPAKNKRQRSLVPSAEPFFLDVVAEHWTFPSVLRHMCSFFGSVSALECVFGKMFGGQVKIHVDFGHPLNSRLISPVVQPPPHPTTLLLTRTHTHPQTHTFISCMPSFQPPTTTPARTKTTGMQSQNKEK